MENEHPRTKGWLPKLIQLKFWSNEAVGPHCVPSKAALSAVQYGALRRGGPRKVSVSGVEGWLKGLDEAYSLVIFFHHQLD